MFKIFLISSFWAASSIGYAENVIDCPSSAANYSEESMAMVNANCGADLLFSDIISSNWTPLMTAEQYRGQEKCPELAPLLHDEKAPYPKSTWGRYSNLFEPQSRYFLGSKTLSMSALDPQQLCLAAKQLPEITLMRDYYLARLTAYTSELSEKVAHMDAMLGEKANCANTTSVYCYARQDCSGASALMAQQRKLDTLRAVHSLGKLQRISTAGSIAHHLAAKPNEDLRNEIAGSAPWVLEDPDAYYRASGKINGAKLESIIHRYEEAIENGSTSGVAALYPEIEQSFGPFDPSFKTALRNEKQRYLQESKSVANMQNCLKNSGTGCRVFDLYRMLSLAPKIAGAGGDAKIALLESCFQKRNDSFREAQAFTEATRGGLGLLAMIGIVAVSGGSGGAAVGGAEMALEGGVAAGNGFKVLRAASGIAKLGQKLGSTALSAGMNYGPNLFFGSMVYNECARQSLEIDGQNSIQDGDRFLKWNKDLHCSADTNFSKMAGDMAECQKQAVVLGSVLLALGPGGRALAAATRLSSAGLREFLAAQKAARLAKAAAKLKH